MRQDKGKEDVNIKDIRIVKKLGATVEDSEMIKGVILTQQKIAKKANGPTRVQNAKIGKYK